MKIIIVAPKTITKHRFDNTPLRYDLMVWNFLIPLMSLGHDTTLFDTSQYGDKELQKLIEDRKPDLLFCIMTGDKGYCPHEPWSTIIDETKKGRLKTFNWFCDDTWRFENFSSKVCWNFHACSTPEEECVDKFKDINYNNILYATWHANADLYSNVNAKRQNQIAFIGAPHGDRKVFLDALRRDNIPLFSPANVAFEDAIWAYSSSTIGINFSKNPGNKKPQMKCRMFEIPATEALLLTEYHKNLENCYDVDKEIVTFKSESELITKVKFLIKNPAIVKQIARRGYERYLKEHESKIRLESVIAELEKI